METLRKAILEQGQGIGSDIVKVDMFLNHRLDTRLIFDMGRELADHFRRENPDIVLTVEASGIAIALTAAHYLGDIPVVFAKKSGTSTQSADMLTAVAHSFTHGNDNTLRVDRRYLPKGSRVLVVDDFLADGQASQALIRIVEQGACTLVGVGIAVEKGFQPGGKRLREAGINLKSLAIVDAIADGKIILREDA
ncbi:MAG: xanthine phosphoribosyltransferase [Clostridia bacterium]|nr:xanthine phosphoribosyltransferase [Clostridia bacterium]